MGGRSEGNRRLKPVGREDESNRNRRYGGLLMLIQGIKTVGICGIGQMGSACTVAFCRAGYDVIPWARNADKLELIDQSLEALGRWCDGNLDRSSRIRRETWE